VRQVFAEQRYRDETMDVIMTGYRDFDDFYACDPPPDGRAFVSNIDYVESALWKLVN
jgi:hypothetical protein